MKVLRLNKKTGDKKIVEYPNIDINSPILGLDPDIEFYGIVEENPSYDPSKFNRIRSERLENTSFMGIPHLKIYIKGWIITEKTQEEVLSKINSSLGSYIETNYPLWKQIKHNSELIGFSEKTAESLTIEEISRINYIKGLQNKIKILREERDNLEHNYITNGVFPYIGWENIANLSE